MPTEFEILTTDESAAPALPSGRSTQERLEIRVQTQSVVPHVRVSRTVGWELLDLLCRHLRISFSCDDSHFTIYFWECDALEAQARLDAWMAGKSQPSNLSSKSARLSSWIVG